MGEFFLLTPEAPNNNLIMASFRSILEIHVVYRIVPGCGNLAKIDFPLGHFRIQLAYSSFAQALALIWKPPPPPLSPFCVCIVRGETILQISVPSFGTCGTLALL